MKAHSRPPRLYYNTSPFSELYTPLLIIAFFFFICYF